MPAEERLAVALDHAIAAFSAGTTATEIVQRALRVAVLRQDLLAESWLRLELAGTKKEGERVDDLRPLQQKLAALVGDEEARTQWNTSLDHYIARHSQTVNDHGEPLVMGQGLADLEVHVRNMRAVYDEPIQPGMTEIDTGLAAIDRLAMRASLFPTLVGGEAIVARVKDAAYRYLMEAEASLLAGQVAPDVIVRGHMFVEEQLSVVAPEAAAALASAKQRLEVADSEALSHATTSSRRAIKALADALYPPGPPVEDDHGISRSMDDDHYRNRLTEYLRQQRGKSTHADMMVANVATLGGRLKSLDDLASKGVHSAVSIDEAESCLNAVYLLAADVLRVHRQAVNR